MSAEPSDRPRPHAIQRALQQVGTGMSERSDLGLIMYSGVKEKMRLAGFRNADAFLNDLNQGTLARYQDVLRDGSRIVNVYFYRSTWLLTSTDALGGNQEQLVAKDAGKLEPDELRRRARGAHPCRLKVREGTSNAADLMNDLYDRQQQWTTKEAEKRRRDHFKVAARVLTPRGGQRSRIRGFRTQRRYPRLLSGKPAFLILVATEHAASIVMTPFIGCKEHQVRSLRLYINVRLVFDD